MNLNEELPLINMKRMKTSPSRQFHRFSEFFALMRNGFTKRWDGRERGIYSFMGHRSGFLCKARWRKRHKTNGMMVASKREQWPALVECFLWSSQMLIFHHHKLLPPRFHARHFLSHSQNRHLQCSTFEVSTCFLCIITTRFAYPTEQPSEQFSRNKARWKLSSVRCCWKTKELQWKKELQKQTE